MEKIALVVDSTADLPLELAIQWDIRIVSLQIIDEQGTSKRDLREMAAAEIMERVAHEKLSSSLPLARDILDTFTQLKNDGYTHIIAFPISSGLSGSYNLYHQMTDIMSDELTIAIIDGKTASVGQRYPLQKAVQMRQTGSTFQEIVDEINRLTQQYTACFSVETLKYLHRGGRVSTSAKIIGSLMDIRPLITFDSEGKLKVFAKVRGNKGVIKKILQHFETYVGDKPVEHISLVHGDSQEAMKELKHQLEKKYPHIDMDFQPISSLLMVHTGPQIFGAGIFLKKE